MSALEEPETLKALLAIPTRGQVWYETAAMVGHLSPVYYRDKLSVASNRNNICKDFLADKWGHKDVLYMIDDDVIPPTKTWAEQMAQLPYDIVGLPTPMSKLPDLPVVLNIFNRRENGDWVTCQDQLPETGHMPVDAVGFGVIMIHRHVLEHPEMTRPFDQTMDDKGTIQVGQDFSFCIRAKELGFSIGVSGALICDHYVGVHLNAVVATYDPPRNSPTLVTD